MHRFTFAPSLMILVLGFAGCSDSNRAAGNADTGQAPISNPDRTSLGGSSGVTADPTSANTSEAPQLSRENSGSGAGGPGGNPGGPGGPVPEPGTLLLVGTGLAGLTLLRRRRKDQPETETAA